MDITVDLVTGIWVEVVATVGVGAVEFAGVVGVVVVDWARTLSLYPHLAITLLFFLSVGFGVGAFLTLGLVLHWAGCPWVCCRWVCCTWVFRI